MPNDIPKRPWFGWFKVWRLNRAIDYQSDLLAADSRFQILKREYDHLIQQHGLDYELREVTTRHDIAVIKRLNQLELRAEELGMSLPTYEEYQLAQIRLTEKAGEADIEIDKTRRLDELKLAFKRLSDMQDLHTERQRLDMQIQAALQYKYLDVQATLHMLEVLAQSHQKKYEIVYSGQPRLIIQEKLKDIEVVINGARDGPARLIQSDKQIDTGGSDSDTIGSRLLESDLGTSQE